MCDFIFEHRERQRKKHFCLLRCLSAFATPIKLYFRCVFKLLPYVALALTDALFLIRAQRPAPFVREENSLRSAPYPATSGGAATLRYAQSVFHDVHAAVKNR